VASAECPITNTHSRLQQAHILWHQTLASYDDPELFRANLNSAVEALRNVTFLLQAEKEAVPDFEPWYEQWRARMKADKVMAWLHDARTTVVHKADLETHSTAVAEVHNNLTLATLRFDIPPTLPTIVACSSLVSTLPEPFASHREHLVIAVERRWIVKQLADYELLDALGHSYGVLSVMLREAHKRAGRMFVTGDNEGNVVKHRQGRLPCMITTKELRTARIALADLRPLVPGQRSVPFELGGAEKLQKRYGPIALSEASDDPFKYAEELVKQAKRVLQKDKTHIRIFFLRTPNGWKLYRLEARDRSEKYVLLRVIADDVRKNEADVIIEIGEAWFAPFEEIKGGTMPEEAPGRREALIVSVATSKGEFRSHLTPFRRTLFGKIKFEETRVSDSPFPAYMAPISEVWGLPMPKPAEGGHTDLLTDQP
jgi:hypothetical protein